MLLLVVSANVAWPAAALSQASPTLFWSPSTWLGLGTRGQLSVSNSPSEFGTLGGAIPPSSSRSHASGTPSPSASAHRSTTVIGTSSESLAPSSSVTVNVTKYCPAWL